MRRYEVLAFVVAAVVGAVGGAAFVVLNAGIGPAQFDWSQSGLALVILIVGGSGTVYGAVIGAVIYVFASELSNVELRHHLAGVFRRARSLALVLLMPGGVGGAVRLASQRLRRRLA